MIPNQWYAVLDSGEVKRGKPLGVTRMGEKLVFWRDSAGKVACLRDKCAHRGVQLSKGVVKGDNVMCPFHGFEYDPSGRGVVIPANGRGAEVPARFQVGGYPVREAHGFIWLWWGEPREEYPPLPFFDNVPLDQFSYRTYPDHWNAHYSRAIENQLDVVHLPFVHHNTIGRGNKSLVNGPGIRWVDDELNVVVFNEVDRGQKPQSPDEVLKTGKRPFLHFRFPNVWQNHISEDMRIVVAFAPIDDENTILYLRPMQKFMKAPVLRHIVDLFSTLGSIVIAHQDRRVVETQRPKPSGLKIGENLVQGDGPIVAYRRRRQELIDAAAPPAHKIAD